MSFLAITTRYCGASNHRQARVIASTHPGRRVSIQVPWDHALGVDQNHAQAARKLALQMEWHGRWFGGSTERATVFVRVPAGADNSDASFCC